MADLALANGSLNLGARMGAAEAELLAGEAGSDPVASGEIDRPADTRSVGSFDCSLGSNGSSSSIVIFVPYYASIGESSLEAPDGMGIPTGSLAPAAR